MNNSKNDGQGKGLEMALRVVVNLMEKNKQLLEQFFYNFNVIKVLNAHVPEHSGK